MKYILCRYDRPLLEIVGLTSTEKTFNLGFAFMGDETEETYTWVLRQVEGWCPDRPRVIVTDKDGALVEAIPRVFPDAQHNLCEVHMHRNIEENAFKKSRQESVQREFSRDCYTLFRSSSEESFDQKIAEMEDRWGTRWGLMDYLALIWVKHKEKVAWYLTDQHLHLGNKTTNRYLIHFYLLNDIHLCEI